MKSGLPGDLQTLPEPLRIDSKAPSRTRPGWLNSRWSLRVLLAIFLLLQIGAGLAGPKTDVEHYRRAADRLLTTGNPYGEKKFGFLYPPTLAGLFLVGVPFPARAVAIAWVLASAVVLTIVVARLAGGRAWVVLLALAFTPFAATQWDGQANALVLLAIAVARPLLSRRELAGGLAVGASLAVKPVALLAAAALAARNRIRAAGIAFAVLLASFLIVLPFGGSPLKAANKFRAILSRPVANPSGDPNSGIEIALTGTLDRLLGAEASRLRQAALKSIPFVVLAAASFRKLPPGATFDAVLAGSLLGARFSWLHHATVLFPAVVSLGPRTATVVAALFVMAAGKRFLGPGATAFGTISLALITIAPLVIGPRREAADKDSSGP